MMQPKRNTPNCGGAPKSQRAWSKFSSGMRKCYRLESVKLRDSDGHWKYYWSTEEDVDEESE